VAETLAEVQQMIVESIEFHIEGLIELGLPIPQPTSIAQEVEVLI
jgi:predicted RNase H-like HicB family nuclease